MKLETKINKLNDEINSIQEHQDMLENIKRDLIEQLYYLKSCGFVKCSTSNKPIKNHR